MNVADALIPKTYSSTDVIVRQGDPADGMFFVESGLVEVYVEGGAGNRKKVKTYAKKMRKNKGSLKTTSLNKA